MEEWVRVSNWGFGNSFSADRWNSEPENMIDTIKYVVIKDTNLVFDKSKIEFIGRNRHNTFTIKFKNRAYINSKVRVKVLLFLEGEDAREVNMEFQDLKEMQEYESNWDSTFRLIDFE